MVWISCRCIKRIANLIKEEKLIYDHLGVHITVTKSLNLVNITFMQDTYQNEILHAVEVATLPLNFRPKKTVGAMGHSQTMTALIELQVTEYGILRFNRSAGTFSFGSLTYSV